MKVNFTISEVSLKRALRKEHEEVLEDIGVGKSYNQKVNGIRNIFSIALFILGSLIFYNSFKIYNEEKLVIMGIGLVFTLIGVISSLKYNNKFSVEYIEKERFEIIKHRNKDVLLGTGNGNKEEIIIKGILEVKDEFIEITFGKIKKIYGIDSFKKIFIEDSNVVLEFESIKYYINKKYFTQKDINKLKDLAKLKSDKAFYEIKEKVFKEINFKNYFVANTKKVNSRELINNLYKMRKKESLFTIDVSLIGIFLMAIGSGEFQNENIRIGIFLVFLIIVTPFLLKPEKEKEVFLEKSKEKNKFISNLNLKKVRVYLGEYKNYIFIGDDITVVNKQDFNIKKDGDIVEINLFNKEFLNLVKEEKEGKVILELNKTIPYEGYLEWSKKELNNGFKKMYRSNKLKKVVFLYIIIIFILSKTNLRGFQSTVLILMAYGVFYFNGQKLKAKINKEFIKIKTLHNKEKKDINLKIKIFKDRVTIEENDYLKRIYSASEITINEDVIYFGKSVVPRDKFTETEIKIIKNLNKEEKFFIKNKEVSFKGKDLSEIKDELTTMLEKMVINLFNGAFLALLIWSFAIGISIEKVIGISLAVGTIIFYIVLMKIIKSEYKGMVNGYINIYILKDKLYVDEESEGIKEYNLNNLDIKYEGKNILIKRNEEKIFFIKVEEERNLELKMKLNKIKGIYN